MLFLLLAFLMVLRYRISPQLSVTNKMIILLKGLVVSF